MDIPTLTLLFALIFPYPFTVLAKWSKAYDNRQGRIYLENTTGWRRTCYWIHLNSLEAIPIAGVSILYALMKGLSPHPFYELCLVWMASRILYAVFYLMELATLRSVIWSIGYGILLFIVFLAGRS